MVMGTGMVLREGIEDRSQEGGGNKEEAEKPGYLFQKRPPYQS
jgi:hypothetical protein